MTSGETRKERISSLDPLSPAVFRRSSCGPRDGSYTAVQFGDPFSSSLPSSALVRSTRRRDPARGGHHHFTPSRRTSLHGIDRTGHARSEMAAAIYGTEVSRCVSTVGDTDDTLFVVGTQKLRGNNEVHLVAHDRDRNALVNKAVWAHHPEIWDLQFCPNDARLLATIYNASSGGNDYGAAVWRLPGGISAADLGTSSTGAAADRAPLESAASIVGLTGKAPCVRWSDSLPGVLLTVDEAHVKTWAIDAGGGKAECTASGATGEGRDPGGASWDPHLHDALAVASGTAATVWDIRDMHHGPAQSIPNAHALQVRDVDYNPRRSHVIATAGDDGKVRLWDMRAHEVPLEELVGHSHWVWRARFNPVYDELILTSSSDATVRLWRDSAHSSSAEGAAGERDTGRLDNDVALLGSIGRQPRGGVGGGGDPGRGSGAGEDAVGQVHCFDDHEDSVYGATWSAADPWCFASLSYDGRLVLNTVPRAEKYRILL